jgi:hypothetical protein
MNKILEGAKEALEVARGNMPAAKVTSFVGGPYDKGDIHRTLIQHRVADHWIAWNWDTGSWDKAMQPFEVLPDPTAH